MFSIGPFSRYRFSESDRVSTTAPGLANGVATVSGIGARAGIGTSAGAATVTGIGGRAAASTVAAAATVIGIGARAARGAAAGSASVSAIGAPAARGTSSGLATVRGRGSTQWDLLLEADQVPMAYFAEIEPWVLADRS